VWVIVCTGGHAQPGREVARIGLLPTPDEIRRFDASVTIPDGCPLQRLELRAQGRENTVDRVRLYLSAMSLRRL
ncbi:hypothetical protein OFL77_27540, partial [Escherichia coli]|uniref:hypothetical protein n=1 Tax=Escherichia coli TaxID=562 RepID=UPI0021E0DC6A